MNSLPYIAAAYAVAALGVGGALLVSWLQMRRAEKAVEALRRGE